MDELPSSWLGILIAEGDLGASTTWTVTFLKLLAVIVLVAANGFFVAAEFALVGVAFIAHRNACCERSADRAKTTARSAAKSERLSVCFAVRDHARLACLGLDWRTRNRAFTRGSASWFVRSLATHYCLPCRILDHHFVAHRAW